MITDAFGTEVMVSDNVAWVGRDYNNKITISKGVVEEIDDAGQKIKVYRTGRRGMRHSDDVERRLWVPLSKVCRIS